MDNPESIHQTAIRSMAEKLATEHLNSTFSPEPAQPQTGFNGMDPYATKTAAAGLGLDPNATTLAQPPDSAQSLISQLLNPTDKYDPMNPAGYKHPSLMNALASFGGIYGRTHGQRVQAAEQQHREKMANIRAILGYKQRDQPEYRPFGWDSSGLFEKGSGTVQREPATDTRWTSREGTPLSGLTGFASSPLGIYNRATGEVVQPAAPHTSTPSKGFGWSPQGLYNKTTGEIVSPADPINEVWTKAYMGADAANRDPQKAMLNPNQQSPEDAANQAVEAWQRSPHRTRTPAAPSTKPVLTPEQFNSKVADLVKRGMSQQAAEEAVIAQEAPTAGQR